MTQGPKYTLRVFKPGDKLSRSISRLRRENKCFKKKTVERQIMTRLEPFERGGCAQITQNVDSVNRLYVLDE